MRGPVEDADIQVWPLRRLLIDVQEFLLSFEGKQRRSNEDNGDL